MSVVQVGVVGACLAPDQSAGGSEDSNKVATEGQTGTPQGLGVQRCCEPCCLVQTVSSHLYLQLPNQLDVLHHQAWQLVLAPATAPVWGAVFPAAQVRRSREPQFGVLWEVTACLITAIGVDPRLTPEPIVSTSAHIIPLLPTLSQCLIKENLKIKTTGGKVKLACPPPLREGTKKQQQIQVAWAKVTLCPLK